MAASRRSSPGIASSRQAARARSTSACARPRSLARARRASIAAWSPAACAAHPAAPVARERSSASANASSAASQSSRTVASRPRCRPRLPQQAQPRSSTGWRFANGASKWPQPRGGLRVLEHRARLCEHHADAEAVQARQRGGARQRREPRPRGLGAPGVARRPPRPSPPTRAGQEDARRASPARPRPPRRACRAAAPPSAAAPRASR